jgi:tetratricopeptide (TPR) repeat protein
MRRTLAVLAVPALAVALLLGAGIGLAARSAPTPTAPAVDPAALSRVSGASLDGSIAALQAHLRAQPRDARSWATLGVAYVEQARITGDPTYYPKAEQALARSLAGQPVDNEVARTGQAALAAARHDFSTALARADAALAVNSFSGRALTVRTDALVELGRYEEAAAAAERADAVQPGLPTFARLSYARELRGDVAAARRLLERALQAAAGPADVAFVRYHLGELARGSGDLAGADAQYAAALAASPAYLPAAAGRARVAAARGYAVGAVAAYRRVVDRLPLPEYLVELGDLYSSLGRTAEAEQQYGVVRVSLRLAAANGVGTDLEAALFLADHRDPIAGLAAARAEERRRPGSIAVADAVGWALHANGRHAEALAYARAATRLGTRDARLLYHRGMIETALGRTADARRSLGAALGLDPHFSPLHAPRARAALASLPG